MNKTLFILLFVASALISNAQNKQRLSIHLEDSSRIFIRHFSAIVQQLSYATDSIQRTNLQQQLYQHYVTDSMLMVPNILQPDSIYRAQRPLIPINKLISMLPFSFWQGYNFKLEDSLITIESSPSMRHKKGELTIRVPLKIWGIRTNQTTTHRIGEELLFTLGFSIKGDEVSIIGITKIAFTQKWIFDEPFTKKIAYKIENELVIYLSQLLNNKLHESKRRSACEGLQKKIKNDSIFYWGSDKVLHRFCIKECKALGNIPNLELKQLLIQAFDLSYITGFEKGATSEYIGKHTFLQKIDLSKEKWYAHQEVDWIVVPKEIATSQLSDWQVSNIIIQPLISRK